MATVHDEIDTWLAADLHGELSDKERDALHAHLVDCAACRKTHQEIKTMNKILEETLWKKLSHRKKPILLSNSVCWLVFAVAPLNEADL